VSRVRLRLTLFYALLLGATSAVVLGASYLLVRNHLYRTLEIPVAHQAVAALASQYVLAVIAVVLLAAGGGWLVSGEVLAPLGRVMASQQRFVANASHELRTPMTAIRTAAEVALRDPAPTVDRLRGVLRETVAATDETDRLMASLLTLAAADAGSRQDERVDLGDVVRAALAPGAPIDTELHPTMVRGDATLLARAVANLVDNALRHGRPGAVVKVRLREGELMVANDGAPIAADDLARLAEPFERLQRSSGRGTGLGLSIVKAIAESHGGRLELEAPAGGGLVARLAIPRA
jgi:signal transduction histidine kinase